MHDFSGGGVERMRLRLSAALAARGLSVTIIVHANRGSLAGAVPAGIAVVDLATRRTAADILPLRRLLREQAYDLVISSLNHNNVCVLLARLMAGGRTPVIICQHNALGAEGSLSWKHRVVPIFYFLLWRLASAIVAVSDGVAHDLAATAGIPSKAITTIVNPVIGADLCSLANGPAPHPWLEHCAMPTFLFVGRLTRQKDPETLLHAMALLLKSQPARLILLGQGELFGQLVELTARLGLSECVCFPGFQENPLPWIRHASALVLCSRYEGLGNVLIEALACGTPVIATDCPFGPSEILRGGALGRLVPVGDAATMAHAMRDYATQGVSPAAQRARAREFSVDRCADQHERLIARVLKGRRATSKKVFGLEMASLDADVCASHILTTPADGSVKLVVTPNINHIRHMRRSEFFTACQSASLVCADGLPVALYARLVGLRIKGRVTGCDVFHRLTASPAVKSQRLFFVVESERTSAAAKLWAQSQDMLTQTGIAVAAKDLACNPVGQHLLLDAIDRHKPTILVMTLGAPVSEVFIHRNRANLPACWALCVGQALRVELGLAVRAPRSWQVCGLEWAWRAVREPRRLAVRYVFDALYFPVAVVRDLLSQFS